MTRPTARVLALLEILQSGGLHTSAELAVRLEVDRRTLRRYIDHLVDLDVPIHAVRGRHGGYRLAPGFRMPPLMLTDDEALAVILGLLAERRTGLTATSAAAIESAAAKVRRVLPQARGRKLAALLETVDFTAPARAAATPETGVLLTLAEAARDRRPVTIRYTSRDGRPSERILHPYGIVAHAGRWYVTGADATAGEVRTFRLDRVAAITVLPGRFEMPAGFVPATALLAAFAQAPYRHAVSVLVDGPAEDIRRRLPAGIATVQEVTVQDVTARGVSRTRARVQLRAERLDWVPALLAGLNLPFTIEEPEALREHVRGLAHRLESYAQ